ncbi:MAG: HAMP domain-containing sensor histidine kinase [Oscillospiraceae bacterium]|nr:HAMP domain-containing sensor histidine kinase [Oscillospiraceae bacterium]
MAKMPKRFRRFRLALLFALIVFAIMLVTILIVFGGAYLLGRVGLINSDEHTGIPLLIFALVSLAVGTVMAFLTSKRPLAPIRRMMEATDQIAGGDYSARIDLKGPEELKQLAEKFNDMAEELGSVEMLRSDFVNNFSHEFKTPIVSIRGFAKMLKRDDLTAEERNEYLDIIISESERLSDLSTNVLNLSKIEQQTILTNIIRVNVSEQIRQVIALLDCKMEAKRIQIDFDCDEVVLNANEELLKQVWINLLDNAVKFSPQGGTISIRIVPEAEYYRIAIKNESESLSKESVAHIFDKFYQGDASHKEKGNGLGLTIAKRIAELHDGTIEVQNDKDQTVTLSVVLPGCLLHNN